MSLTSRTQRDRTQAESHQRVHVLWDLCTLGPKIPSNVESYISEGRDPKGHPRVGYGPVHRFTRSTEMPG